MNNPSRMALLQTLRGSIQGEFNFPTLGLAAVDMVGAAPLNEARAIGFHPTAGVFVVGRLTIPEIMFGRCGEVSKPGRPGLRWTHFKTRIAPIQPPMALPWIKPPEPFTYRDGPNDMSKVSA